MSDVAVPALLEGENAFPDWHGTDIISNGKLQHYDRPPPEPFHSPTASNWETIGNDALNDLTHPDLNPVHLIFGVSETGS